MVHVQVQSVTSLHVLSPGSEIQSNKGLDGKAAEKPLNQMKCLTEIYSSAITSSNLNLPPCPVMLRYTLAYKHTRLTRQR